MINAAEKKVIRELAKRVSDLAALPIMDERRQRWFRHNALLKGKPMILVFPEGAWRELVPADSLVCEDVQAREIEWKLRAKIYKQEHIGDDSVAERSWYVSKRISDTGWGVKSISEANAAIGNRFTIDSSLGYVPVLWEKNFQFNESAMGFKPVINEASDLKKIKNPQVIYDEKSSLAALAIEQDLRK